MEDFKRKLLFRGDIGYTFNTGQNACVDIVGWANGFIVNPTLMPSSVGCEK